MSNHLKLLIVEPDKGLRTAWAEMVREDTDLHVEEAASTGEALKKISAFPALYAPEAAKELGELRAGVLAAGREKWEKLHKAARRLAAEKKFAEAEKKVREAGALGLPGLPVDTHVGRIVRRLGITTEEDPVKVEHVLNPLVPAAERGLFSLRLILHGRRVCASRRPRCEDCVLADFCPSRQI